MTINYNQIIVQHLTQRHEPLYAILDAAKGGESLVKFLLSIFNQIQFESLFENKKAIKLSMVAPYLVFIPPPYSILEELLPLSWGNHWGIFFNANASFNDVLIHFRKFLLVKIKSGKELFFRYYDPRVLSKFLPTCDSKQLYDFFGPVKTIYMDDIDPSKLIKYQLKQSQDSKNIFCEKNIIESGTGNK